MSKVQNKKCVIKKRTNHNLIFRIKIKESIIKLFIQNSNKYYLKVKLVKLMIKIAESILDAYTPLLGLKLITKLKEKTQKF